MFRLPNWNWDWDNDDDHDDGYAPCWLAVFVWVVFICVVVLVVYAIGMAVEYS